MVLRASDVVYVNLEGGISMFVVIVGGGRTGAQLAGFLLKQNYEVRLVECRKDVLARMHRDLPTEIIYEGNVIDPYVLQRAGIADADVVAAVTSSDEQNLVVCYLARESYKVPRTIARVNNPRNAWLFTKTFHVDVVVNQAEILAHMIQEEMSMGDMMTLAKLRRGNYSLVAEKVPEEAVVRNTPIKDMRLSKSCVIAGIIRNGEIIVPRGITTFEVGDEVLAVADPEGAKQLADLLTQPGKNNLNNHNNHKN
jgi:trk system potassium uptake protein TrkA